MSTHTPGPWHVAGLPRQTQVRGFINDLTGGALVIATVHNTHEGAKDANARLIAAAPDMLNTLRTILSRAPELDQSATSYGLANCDAIARVRAAIAKAEGA